MIQFNKKAENAIQAYLARSSTNQIAVGIIYKKQSIGRYTSGGACGTTRFDIGSISKTFTAQLILKLVDAGKISLDASVDTYLPLKKGTYPTITQLLTHTAGYGHLTPVEITVPKLLTRRYARANLYRNVDGERVLRALSRRNHAKQNNPYGYSDFAYAILAMVAQKVTGTDFCDLMNGFLHEEFSMQQSEACPTQPRTPTYLGRKPLQAWQWETTNPYLAGGGVVSTLEDMLRYAKIQLESADRSILLAQTVYPASFSRRSNLGTCFGWHTYKKSNQLWHVGGVGAFRSSMIVNRQLGHAVIVMGNAKGGRSANVHYIAKLLYTELKRKHIAIKD